MARHGGAAALAGGQGGNLREGIRARRRAAGGRARRILRQRGNRDLLSLLQSARQSVAGRSVHRRAALAAGRPVARRTGRNPAGGQGRAFLDGAESEFKVQSPKSRSETAAKDCQISGTIFPLAETGAAGFAVAMPGKRAGGDALRRLAAVASARRATAGERRTISRTSRSSSTSFSGRDLFRFLKFIEAQREAEAEPEVAAVAEENAVRLMSIHQSKGLGISGRRRGRSGEAVQRAGPARRNHF